MTILDTHGHLVSPEPNSGCWLWEGATWELAEEIRRDGRSLEIVAAEYGVSDTTISQIRNNKQWIIK